jgi:hypothetical protein
LQQEKEKDKKGENSCFDNDFEKDKEKFILLNNLKRLVISRFSVTQN